MTFVAERAGNYRFYCPVKSLEGTLTVLEPNSTSGGPSAWKLNIQQEIQISEGEYLRISYLE